MACALPPSSSEGGGREVSGVGILRRPGRQGPPSGRSLLCRVNSRSLSILAPPLRPARNPLTPPKRRPAQALRRDRNEARCAAVIGGARSSKVAPRKRMGRDALSEGRLRRRPRGGVGPPAAHKAFVPAGGSGRSPSLASPPAHLRRRSGPHRPDSHTPTPPGSLGDRGGTCPRARPLEPGGVMSVPRTSGWQGPRLEDASIATPGGRRWTRWTARRGPAERERGRGR
jgi:hypothetical protein